MSINYYENLILSGGGVRGLYYLGFMKYFKDTLHKFKNLVGSSIGSFFAVAISLGYTDEEILPHVLNILDYNRVKSLKVFDFLENLGLDDGSKMEHYIKKMIRYKFGKKELTFKQLYETYHKNVTITAISIEDNCVIYFSKESHPLMKVWKAVRMAMTVPFLFKPYTYKEKNYIDGGLRHNFPIDLYPSKYTLGIDISTIPKISKKLNFEEYIFSLVGLITTSNSTICDQEIIKLNSSFDPEHPLVPFDANINENIVKNAIDYSYTTLTEYYEQKEKQTNEICQEIIINIISKLNLT
jgi:predicted acylesterase/phospholipase RssA